MPRLSDDQVKAGILHADADARQAAVRYFSDAYSRDPTVMPAVIEAFERYGLKGAFRWGAPYGRLAQTEAALRWVVERLKAAGDEIDLDGGVYRLGEVLCEADPRLVAPFEAEALAAPGLDPDQR